jgi:hypothetical protein
VKSLQTINSDLDSADTDESLRRHVDVARFAPQRYDTGSAFSNPVEQAPDIPDS